MLATRDRESGVYALEEAFAACVRTAQRSVTHPRSSGSSPLLQEFERVESQASAKRNIKEVIQHVAARLGNTPTICRKCYIHPEIITTYIEGSLPLQVELRQDLHGLRPEEAAVLMLLHARLSMTLEDKLAESVVRLGTCTPRASARR